MLAVILRLMKKRGHYTSPMPLSWQGRVRSQSRSQSPTLMVIGAEKDVLKELPQASKVLSYTCTPVFSARI